MRQIDELNIGERTRIELVSDKRGVVGLGRIWIDNIQIRNGDETINWRIDTPDGYVYTIFEKNGVATNADGSVHIRLKAVGFPWNWSEYHDEYNMPLACTDKGDKEVEDEVELILAPVGRSLAGKDWAGFSYSLRFTSAARKIHHVSMFATWEIDGHLTGNTLYHQGQVSMPVYHGEKDTAFTTTCLKQLHRYQDPQGVSFQMGPRGTINQTFDLICADKGALCLYWPDFDDIKCLVDSPKGCDCLHMVDEYRFELTNDATISPKEVLFTSGVLAEHDRRNIWWSLYQHVNGGIRQKFGVEENPVKAELYRGFWHRADGNTVKTQVGNLLVDPKEALYAYADTILPELAAAGSKRTLPEPISESDVTVLGMKRKLDDGGHGDHLCASVCGTHRFFPSEFFGGIKAWRYAYDKAHSLGIELGHWFAGHFSPRAAIFKEHPEYLLVEKDSMRFGGGYSEMIQVADWRTGIYQWVLDDLKRWKDEGGLDYLWMDSWSNLSSLGCNYAQNMRTNWEPFGRLFADIQKIGIKSFNFEGISPYGPSRFGAFDPRGDILDVRGGIAGQNDFGWWVGNEDMLFNIYMMVKPQKREVRALLESQFKAMASRGYIFYQTDIFSGEVEKASLCEESALMNRAYDAVLPHMKTRHLLPDGAGVCWEDGNTQILWSFRPVAITYKNGAQIEVVNRRELHAAGNNTYKLPAYSVLKVTNGGPLSISAI